MSDVTATIEIDAPIEEVWAVVMNPQRLHEWVTIHKQLLEFDDRSMVQVMTLRGAPFKVHWELTVSDPPHRAHWKGRGPARSHAEIEYLLSEKNGGTRFDYRNEFEAPGGPIGRVASRALVGHAPQTEADNSLRRLKELLEAAP